MLVESRIGRIIKTIESKIGIKTRKQQSQILGNSEAINISDQQMMEIISRQARESGNIVLVQRGRARGVRGHRI